MNYLAFISIITISLITACSESPLEVDEDQIQSSVTQGELNITNGSDQTIYYAVFDREILALINWAAVSTEENKMPGFSSKSFKLGDIFQGDKMSGEVVFTYWEEKEPKSEDLKSIIIKVK